VIPPSRSRPQRVLVGLILLATVTVLAGCGVLDRTAPAPTPADFPGLAGFLGQRGIRIDRIISGDAGCEDLPLARTAIGFDASGLDQPTPVRVRIYIFRNRATYERLRETVDGCAAAYVTDPATFESVETSPFVVAGQGPWGTGFKTALREAIVAAAGTGG
jgi:hypothetical protein